MTKLTLPGDATDRTLPSRYLRHELARCPRRGSMSEPCQVAKTPDLSRKLAHTIKPSRGPAAQLETLADAAQLIADLEQFRQARPVWDRAAEMLLLAAQTGRKANIAEATRCVLVSLEKENWLKGTRS